MHNAYIIGNIIIGKIYRAGVGRVIALMGQSHDIQRELIFKKKEFIQKKFKTLLV